MNMGKDEVEETTRKTIENGGILAKLYFDMQSDKKEDLQPLMTDLISNKILKSAGVVYCYGSIDEPIQLDDVYSTNAQAVTLFKDLSAMVNVAFNFAPAGVEIIKPEKELVLKIPELQSIILSLSNISVDYSQYILSKVLPKEDLDKMQKTLKTREELGKKLIENKGNEEEKKD